MSQQTKKTLLYLLRYFYDEEVFSLLIKYFYETDPQISLTAIESSASLGNEIAVPHLYKIIESGRLPQKFAAIKALAEIKAPSSIQKLTEYFNLFSEIPVKTAILDAINQISPLNHKAEELNKATILTSGQDPQLCRIAAQGLIRANKLSILTNYFKTAPALVQQSILAELLELSGQEISGFVEGLKEYASNFVPTVLGIFLCVYELKARETSLFVLENLRKSTPEVIRQFIIHLSAYKGRIAQPKRILRLLLQVPFTDFGCESKIGGFINDIISEIRKNDLRLFTDFNLMVQTHIETIFSKIKKQFLSIKGIQAKSSLLVILLAQLLEKYASAKLLLRIQNYFQAGDTLTADMVVEELKKALDSAPPEDRNKLKACLPLFYIKNTKTRLYISSNISYVNLDRPNLLRRLNRLIRIAGNLGLRKLGKQLLDMLAFSQSERIDHLLETTIVTLCQLQNCKIIEQLPIYFNTPAKSTPELLGYIRGARFLPLKTILFPIMELINNDVSGELKDLCVDTLASLNLGSLKNNLGFLIQTLKNRKLSDEQRLKVGQIISKYLKAEHLQSFIDLSHAEETIVKIVALMSIREILASRTDMFKDILINRLYVLLNEKDMQLNVQTLLTLIELEDDYALEILDDYLGHGNHQFLIAFVEQLNTTLPALLLSFVPKLLASENADFHEKLRLKLGEISNSNLSQELRNILISDLLVTKGMVSPQPAQNQTLITKAKQEFIIKRERLVQLTVFFIDIVGYTEKTSLADNTALLQLIQSFESAATPELIRFKGNIIKKMGDGMMVTFNHPLNAVLAAISIRDRIANLNQYQVENEKFNVRIGINTGEVLKKDGDIFGDTVNVASRMETAANPGEILMTSSSYEAAKEYIECIPLGNIQVKGKKEAIMAYLAVQLHPHIRKTYSPAPSSKTNQKQIEGKTELENLSHTETIVTPEYNLPAEIDLPAKVAREFQDTFIDLTEAVEEFARNYYEENELKKYLQERWNKFIENIKLITAARK